MHQVTDTPWKLLTKVQVFTLLQVSLPFLFYNGLADQLWRARRYVAASQPSWSSGSSSILLQVQLISQTNCLKTPGTRHFAGSLEHAMCPITCSTCYIPYSLDYMIQSARIKGGSILYKGLDLVYGVPSSPMDFFSELIHFLQRSL